MVLGVPGPATSTVWSRVDAPHFTVSGDASPENVRHVASLLEMFREVFARVLPGARDRALVPPFVIVFGSDKAFTPYKPVYGGKPAPVGGYVIREPLAPCMALWLDRSGESYRTIFHEYAHVIFDAPRVPLWLSEGVADYYSTATLHRDRLRVLLGAPVPTHLAQLSRAFVPVDQLVSTSRSAKIWDTEAGRTFYAESWALVHYLVRGTAARGAQIARFLEELASGEDEAAAFARTIGPPRAIDAELRRYLRNGMASPEEIALPAQVDIEPLRARPMTEAEVEATLGRLLFQLHRDEEAIVRLDAAIGLDPNLAEAHATLGLLRVRQGRPTDGLGQLRHANARDPGNILVAYSYAVVALQAHDAQLPAPLEEAWIALDRVARRDGPAEPLAVLGTIAGRLGRLDEAERLLRRASSFVPARTSTEIELADVFTRLGRFDEARDILSRLAAATEGPDADTVARHRGWLVMAEARARLRAELATAAGLTGASRDRAIERTGRFPKPTGFRAPRAGEQRLAGLLDALDCTHGGIVARLTTALGVIRFDAGSLDEVDVATSREDAGRTLSCGVMERREAVYVTWRGDHHMVAIEFLPEDLAPGR
jgi:tetratricopeptide (TPR) repeat protein